MFSISIPNLLELRGSGDPYSQATGKYNTGAIIFQQKDLSKMKKSAYNYYCRIMISANSDFNKNELPNCNENINIDANTHNDLLSFARQQLSGQGIMEDYSFVGHVSISNSKVNAYKAIRTHYIRTGSKRYGNAEVNIYHLFNNNQMIIIIASYSVAQKSLWQPIINAAVNSFKWLHPHYLH